ncbi:hypothetical protein B0H63DRAFT_65371 [Podospora didyma]|uniref:Uncharacterized protein n=1 Tax=Podospora didyma TaxID=330526 RepID=A0AAE0P8F1_9PEZI|nr:hypothetical protein B0H63DRAFT_65371 [Podospora didyma]
MPSSNPGQAPSSGPPYLPTTASPGGLPTPIPDDAVSGVLLLFFVCGAAFHMTTFQINRRRGHKFIFSVLLFGFCMARIAALTMRIVWASYPTNVNVAIAANIFVAAGVLLLFIVNLLFTQRMVRAYHPNFGWNRTITMAFRFLIGSVIALLIMVIVATVHSFFTLDPDARQKDRSVQLFAGTYLAVLAFLPIPILTIASLYPRSHPIEKFGYGSFRTKMYLVLGTATILTLGAGFRIGVNFDPRPINQPAWYHSKPAYYCFNYVIELIVVYSYGLAGFDRRFHIPDGASGPGHYSGANKSPSSTARDEEDVVTDLETLKAPDNQRDRSATLRSVDKDVTGEHQGVHDGSEKH